MLANDAENESNLDKYEASSKPKKYSFQDIPVATILNHIAKQTFEADLRILKTPLL